MSDATDALNAIDLLRAILSQERTEKRYYMAENARLREELENAPKCEACEAMLDCDECLRADGSHKERRRLKAENAKLRELVRDLYEMAYPEFPSAFEATFADRMRELRVDVDG